MREKFSSLVQLFIELFCEYHANILDNLLKGKPVLPPVPNLLRRLMKVMYWTASHVHCFYPLSLSGLVFKIVLHILVSFCLVST